MKNYYVKEQFLKKRQKFILQTNSAVNAAMEQSDKEQYTDKTIKNIAWHGEIRGEKHSEFQEKFILGLPLQTLENCKCIVYKKSSCDILPMIRSLWFIFHRSWPVRWQTNCFSFFSSTYHITSAIFSCSLLGYSA